MHRTHQALALCGMAAVLSGCGSAGLQREHVVGEVTVNGKSLESGRIRFISDGGQLQTTAGIQEGRFELASTEGLPAGDYRVEIESDPDLGFPIDDDVAFAKRGRKRIAPKAPIPAQYNRDSTLTVTVVPGCTNPLDFPITFRDNKN